MEVQNLKYQAALLWILKCTIIKFKLEKLSFLEYVGELTLYVCSIVGPCISYLAKL